jgi:hypothetical protein
MTGPTLPERLRDAELSAWLGRRRGGAQANRPDLQHTGQDQIHISDEVKFSLRYGDDDRIARELGELPALNQAVTRPVRGDQAGPDTRE